MILSRDRDFYRKIITLSGWIALQNIIICMVGLIDNVMIGAYSQTALSGVALANQIQFLLQMLIGGVGEGMGVLTAQYWGAGRMKPIRHIVAIATGVGFFLGLLFMLTGQLWPRELLGLYTQDEAIVAEGAMYMRVVSFSYPFFCIGLVLVNAYRSMERVAVGMVASIGALIMNTLLNWVLIFGKLGFPVMGVQGAAVATMIARLVECGIVLGYTYGVDKKIALRLREFLRPDAVMSHDFWKVATPVILSGGSWGIAMSVQTGILGRLGSTVIAADSIAGALFQVISVAAYGMAAASAVVVGKAVGRGRKGRLREYVHTLQLLFVAVGLISGALLFVSKDWILSLYSISLQAMDMARSFMVVLSITIVGTAYQVSCLTGIVRGGGNTKFVFYNDLLFMWGIVLPLSMLAAFVWHWNPIWVFFCLKSDQLLKCVVAVWQVNSYRWVHRVVREDVPSVQPAEEGLS